MAVGKNTGGTKANDTKPEVAVVVAGEESKQTNSKEESMRTECEEKVIAPISPSSKKKCVRIFLTISAYLNSLPLLAMAVWLLYTRGYECEALLKLPRLQIGIAIALIFLSITNVLIAFLAGRSPMPGIAFLVVMVPLFVMLFVGLSYVGVDRTASLGIAGTPSWLRLKVEDSDHWSNIKSCIYDSRVCSDLISRSVISETYDINLLKLSSVEDGCCRPPKSCEVNATFWLKGRVGASNLKPQDVDCDRWMNEKSIMCLDCHSCKEGYLRTLQRKWWKLGIFLVLNSLILIISHVLLFGFLLVERCCCAPQPKCIL